MCTPTCKQFTPRPCASILMCIRAALIRHVVRAGTGGCAAFLTSSPDGHGLGVCGFVTTLCTSFLVVGRSYLNRISKSLLTKKEVERAFNHLPNRL